MKDMLYLVKSIVLFLGAGASKNSGIRTGEQLMKEWHKYLWAEERGNEYIQECAMELDPRYGRDTYKRFFDQNYEIKTMIILIYLICVLQEEQVMDIHF